MCVCVVCVVCVKERDRQTDRDRDGEKETETVLLGTVFITLCETIRLVPAHRVMDRADSGHRGTNHLSSTDDTLRHRLAITHERSLPPRPSRAAPASAPVGSLRLRAARARNRADNQWPSYVRHEAGYVAANLRLSRQPARFCLAKCAINTKLIVLVVTDAHLLFFVVSF